MVHREFLNKSRSEGLHPEVRNYLRERGIVSKTGWPDKKTPFPYLVLSAGLMQTGEQPMWDCWESTGAYNHTAHPRKEYETRDLVLFAEQFLGARYQRVGITSPNPIMIFVLDNKWDETVMTLKEKYPFPPRA